MECQTLQYRSGRGWNVDAFPDLDSENTLVLVFAAPAYFQDPSPIKELADYYKQSKMIGCSSAGEIYGGGIADNSVSVAIVRFSHTTVRVASAQVMQISDSFVAGQQLGEALAGDALKSMFVLSEGLTINGSELVYGLNHILQHAKPIITGGLAGDGNQFKHTWTILNGELLTNHVVAVGLYGERLQVGHASKGGWDIFGPERQITRSTGNILYELDGQPALQFYKDNLGEKASELPSSGLLYPLSISNPLSTESAHLVRTMLGIDETNQSVIFAGDMPTGYYAQLMRANIYRLIESANEAGQLACFRALRKEYAPENPMLLIAVSCVGRRLLLAERTKEEVQATIGSLPDKTMQIGFYSYGELSPYSLGRCELHNQTMTITSFYEI